jgi:hypothetical protein
LLTRIRRFILSAVDPTNFDQVIDDGSNGAAGMERHVKIVSLAHLSVLLQERLNHLAPGIGAHQQRLLGGRIVTKPKPIYVKLPTRRFRKRFGELCGLL